MVQIGSSLKYLDLSRNRIKNVHRGAFATTVNLEYLNISQNKLKRIERVSMPMAGSLTTLDLSGNDITHVHDLSLSAAMNPDCAIPVSFLFDSGSPPWE